MGGPELESRRAGARISLADRAGRRGQPAAGHARNEPDHRVRSAGRAEAMGGGGTPRRSLRRGEPRRGNGRWRRTPGRERGSDARAGLDYRPADDAQAVPEPGRLAPGHHRAQWSAAWSLPAADHAGCREWPTGPGNRPADPAHRRAGCARAIASHPRSTPTWPRRRRRWPSGMPLAAAAWSG